MFKQFGNPRKLNRMIPEVCWDSFVARICDPENFLFEVFKWLYHVIPVCHSFPIISQLAPKLVKKESMQVENSGFLWKEVESTQITDHPSIKNS